MESCRRQRAALRRRVPVAPVGDAAGSSDGCSSSSSSSSSSGSSGLEGRGDGGGRGKVDSGRRDGGATMRPGDEGRDRQSRGVRRDPRREHGCTDRGTEVDVAA